MTATEWVCACGCDEVPPAPTRPGRHPGGVLYIRGHQQRIDPDRQEKPCTRCGEVKPRDGFHRNRGSNDGLANFCKPCAIANSKAWHHKTGRYTSKGTTPEDYRKVWEAQEGLCAICERRPIEHIDHDHATGEFRGLLCPQCNTGLGKLGDSVAGLRKALAYLEQAEVIR